MPDKPRVYFTRDGELVHLRTNTHLCAEGKDPLDIKIGPGSEFFRLSFETLWDAGSGIIETQSKVKGRITEISLDPSTKISDFRSSVDECIWYLHWTSGPIDLIPFKKNFDTSKEAYWLSHPELFDTNEYGIVENGEAIKTGRFKGKPLSQVYDWELDEWVDNSNRVFDYINGDLRDDPFDAGWTYNIEWVSEEKMDAYIAKVQKRPKNPRSQFVFFFTQDGASVRIQSNHDDCEEGEIPLDISIAPGDQFEGVPFEKLWNAGAGHIEKASGDDAIITWIRTQRNDQILGWKEPSKMPIWYFSYPKGKGILIRFIMDRKISLKEHVRAAKKLSEMP